MCHCISMVILQVHLSLDIIVLAELFWECEGSGGGGVIRFPLVYRAAKSSQHIWIGVNWRAGGARLPDYRAQCCFIQIPELIRPTFHILGKDSACRCGEKNKDNINISVPTPTPTLPTLLTCSVAPYVLSD